MQDIPIENCEKERQLAIKHWLYKVIPKHRRQVYWYDLGHWFTWSLLGNDDDGIFGEESTAVYDTDVTISTKRALFWYIRNPLHNFTFYTIGSAQRENSEVILMHLEKGEMIFLHYSPISHADVIDDEHSSLHLALHGGKPFVSIRISYKYVLDSYLGWRWRGNFGAKFLPVREKVSHD